MSLEQIEAELEHLAPGELRRLAIKSWSVFVRKEGLVAEDRPCDEDDPELLAALDDAIAQADSTPGQGFTGKEVLARLGAWSTK